MYEFIQQIWKILTKLQKCRLRVMCSFFYIYFKVMSGFCAIYLQLHKPISYKVFYEVANCTIFFYYTKKISIGRLGGVGVEKKQIEIEFLIAKYTSFCLNEL